MDTLFERIVNVPILDCISSAPYKKKVGVYCADKGQKNKHQ